MSESLFAREGFGWRYEPAGRGVTFRVGHISWKSGELFGVVEITANRAELPSFLTRQRVNMTGGTGRLQLARALGERCGNQTGFDSAAWLAILEGLFVRVGDAEAGGSALEWVGDMEPEDGVPHLIERVIERDGTNVLYGPGDQGKSWLALYFRVCLQLGIKPLGLDVRQCETLAVEYETGADTYNRRLRAVLRGLNQPYQRMRLWRPSDALPRQGEALARILADEQIGFYTIDSAGHAAGSPGEHGSWEDAALALGKTLKVCLPAVPLLIDHTTATGSREKLAGRPSGAYRKMTDARVLWECRKEQEQENAWSLIGMYHTKGNNSIRWRPMGIRMKFESDVWGRAVTVIFERDDEALSNSAEHSQRQGLTEQILAVLDGEMTVYAISQQIGASVDSVAAKLRQLRSEGKTRTVEPPKHGRGHVSRWVQIKPNTERPLKEIPSYSVLGVEPTHPHPKPNSENRMKTEKPNEQRNGYLHALPEVESEEEYDDVPF